MGDLLKFDGRIRRMGWWIAGLGMGLVGGMVDTILDRDLNWLMLMIFGIIAMVVWLIGISLNVRRWHDLNRSGWWILINIIPVVGWIYSFVMLGFMSGDQGSNKYGPAPKEGAIL